MSARKKYLSVLMFFLIGACGDAGPCGTTTWINEEGSLRVRQFNNSEVCEYLNDVTNVLGSGNVTAPLLTDLISSGNDITESATSDGTLDLVVRDAFSDDLSIRAQALGLLIGRPEDGGFGVYLINDYQLVPFRPDAEIPSTGSVAILYQLWDVIINVASRSLPSVPIQEATVHPDQGDHFSIEFQGREIQVAGPDDQ